MNLSIGPMGWGLMVGIPLVAIALSETIERLRRRKLPLAQALRSLRNVTLPLLSVVLILQHILQLKPDYLLFQVVKTALWLSILSGALLLLSNLFTTHTRKIHGKVRVPSLYLVAGRISVVVLCAVYILARIWQIDLAQITSALGVGSLVVALALQDTLSNLVSGFLLLLDRPFNEGDWLQLGDIEAEVLEVNWRSVRLRNRNRDIIIIPNGELGKATICNYTLLETTHAEKVSIGFSYDDPPNVVKPMLMQAVAATAGTLNPPAPLVRVINYGDFSIDYEVKFFLSDYQAKNDICSELRSHIYYMAKRQGLTVPYPISLEYQMQGETLQPAAALEPILNVLQSLTYFAAIESGRLDKLAQEASLETYGAGEQIVQAGKFAPGFFVIQQGRVVLSAPSDLKSNLKNSLKSDLTSDRYRQQNGNSDRNYQKSDNQEIVQLQAGDCFGERVLLRTEPSLVTVTVVEDLTAIRIPPRTIANLAERNTKFARDINQLIEERVRDVQIATQANQPKDSNYLSKLLAT